MSEFSLQDTKQSNAATRTALDFFKTPKWHSFCFLNAILTVTYGLIPPKRRFYKDGTTFEPIGTNSLLQAGCEG
jgi:hypothetical protein